MHTVSFIILWSKMVKRTMSKSVFIFFPIKLCLCDKVNFGLVNVSICCNEISDLSTLIIKQTYIISLKHFFSLTNVSSPAVSLFLSILRTDFWKATCRWVSSSALDFQLPDRPKGAGWSLSWRADCMVWRSPGVLLILLIPLLQCSTVAECLLF